MVERGETHDGVATRCEAVVFILRPSLLYCQMDFAALYEPRKPVAWVGKGSP